MFPVFTTLAICLYIDRQALQPAPEWVEHSYEKALSHIGVKVYGTTNKPAEGDNILPRQAIEEGYTEGCVIRGDASHARAGSHNGAITVQRPAWVGTRYKHTDWRRLPV